MLYEQGKFRQLALAQVGGAVRRAAQLARRQYTEGALSLLEVLDTERSVPAVELAAGRARGCVRAPAESLSIHGTDHRTGAAISRQRAGYLPPALVLGSMTPVEARN